MKPVNIRRDTHETFNRYFKRYLTPEMVVYDIGCGAKPFKLNVREHVGIDIEGAHYGTGHLDVISDAYNIPRENNSADAAISSQVLEHLARPEDAIKETHRLLKPGGLFFISVPFLAPIHSEPHDYSRMTEFQLFRFLKENGFEILEFNRLGGFWYLLGTLVVLYIQPFHKGILLKLKITTLILYLVRIVFGALHALEGFLLRKRNLEGIRMRWVVNYSIVTRKI